MNINDFLYSFEYIGLFLLIFVDSLPFISFFFPGSAILLLGGIFASKGYLNVFMIVTISIIATVIGDMGAYFFGKKLGIKLFTKEDSILFPKDHLAKAQHLYEKFGILIILSYRFIPFLRNVGAIVAGIGNMPFLTFMLWNCIGAIIWVFGMVYLGYQLSMFIPEYELSINLLFLLVGGVLLPPIVIYIYYRLLKKKKEELN
jgi:membrane-associated protein